MRKIYFMLFALLLYATGSLAQVTNTESFDGTTFVPTGWTNLSTSGSNSWSRVTAGTHPTIATHSGSGMARFDSYDNDAGVVSLITPVYSLSNIGSNTATVSFWMYRDAGYSTSTDKIDVFMNTSASLTGATSLGSVNRAMALAPVVATAGWYQYSYNVPASFNTASNFLILKATSNYGNDIYVDDVSWVSYPPGCTGTPAPGNTLSTVNPICSGVSFTLSTTTASIASGITSQWQSSPNGSTWTDITGATSTTLNTSQTVSTYYRLNQTCSGNTGSSTPIQVTMNAFNNCYCTSAATSSGDEDITNVTFGTLNNTSACASLVGTIGTATGTADLYANYSAVGTPVSVQQGATVPYSVQITECLGTAYSHQVSIFIDFNQNGSMDDAGEVFNIYANASSGTHFITGNITIPNSALTGNTRMRVICSEGSFTSSCTNPSYGETEDYTINIVAAALCTAPPTAGTTVTNNATLCANGTVNLSVTGDAIGTGLTYQWQSSPNGTSWSDITGATSATYTSAALTATTYFRRTITCSAQSTYSTPVTVTILNCALTVTRSSGITFTPINSTGTGFTGFTGSDDSYSAATNIGFNFFYKGTTYTQLMVNTNGFLSLGGTSPGASYTNNLSGTTFYPNILAPLWDDWVTQGNAGSTTVGNFIKYQLSGTAPNRVLTVEWYGMERFNFGGPNINFQVKLYETTNNIEFLYGNMLMFDGTPPSGTPSPNSYSIGMTGTLSNVGIDKIMALQTENTNCFNITDPTNLGNSVECNSKYTFTAGTYTPCTPAAATAPVNDEIAGAIVLPVNSSPCTDLCGTYYTSVGATASTSPVSSCTTAPDDDVWFKFTAAASAETITVRSATGYDAVVGLYDASNVEVTGLGCVNVTASGLTETLNATGLTVGNIYSIRVSNNGTGSGNNNGFSICVNQVVLPPSNDDPCGAFALTEGNGVCTPYEDNPATLPSKTAFIAATNTTSNGVTTPSCSGAGATVQDVWFSFVASGTSDIVTVTPKTGTNAAFQLYSSAGTCAGSNLVLTSISCINNGSTGVIESNLFTGLTAGGTYYVRVYAHATGQGGAPVSNSQFSICVSTPPPPPPNDNICNAINLTVDGASDCQNTTYATVETAESALTTCSTPNNTVWYKFTPTVTGPVQIVMSLPTASNSASGFWITLLTATGCPTPVLTVAVPCTGHSLNTTGAIGSDSLTVNVTAGIEYLIQIDGFSGDYGAYCLKLKSPSITPGVDGTCITGGTVTIDATNNNQWVALLDSKGNRIADINANGNNLGLVTPSVFTSTGAVRIDAAGQYYMNRNIGITVATQPTSAVSVRFYIKNSEDASLDAVTNVTTGVSDVLITKVSGGCTTTFSGSNKILITPVANSYGTDWYLQADVNSFSDFFFNKGPMILPASSAQLKGNIQGSTHLLNWNVNIVGATQVTITLEQSSDNVNFASINTQTATAARCANPFDFVNTQTLAGRNYYRLKIVDNNGKISYSNVVTLLANTKGFELVNITPNPVVADAFKLNVTSTSSSKLQIVIADMQGRVVLTQLENVVNGFSAIPVNVAKLAKGTYQIYGYTNNVKSKAISFVKQ